MVDLPPNRLPLQLLKYPCPCEGFQPLDIGRLHRCFLCSSSNIRKRARWFPKTTMAVAAWEGPRQLSELGSGKPTVPVLSMAVAAWEGLRRLSELGSGKPTVPVLSMAVAA